MYIYSVLKDTAVKFGLIRTYMTSSAIDLNGFWWWGMFGSEGRQARAHTASFALNIFLLSEF